MKMPLRRLFAWLRLLPAWGALTAVPLRAEEPEYVRSEWVTRFTSATGAVEAPPYTPLKVLRRDDDRVQVEYQGLKAKCDSVHFMTRSERMLFWQKDAVKRFPDLAVENSEFNRRFRERLEFHRQAQPEYFQNENWAVRLAYEVSEQFTNVPPTARLPAPSPTPSLPPASLPPSPQPIPEPARASATGVAMIRENGVLKVPVKINDALILKFVVDSGASVVTLPADVYRTLLRTETILQSDLLPPANFVLANGQKITNERVLIRSLKVGEVEVANVEASIGDEESSLLLGQSFLSRFDDWKVDNAGDRLVLAALRPAAERSATRTPADGKQGYNALEIIACARANMSREWVLDPERNSPINLDATLDFQGGGVSLLISVAERPTREATMDFWEVSDEQIIAVATKPLAPGVRFEGVGRRSIGSTHFVTVDHQTQDPKFGPLRVSIWVGSKEGRIIHITLTTSGDGERYALKLFEQLAAQIVE